MKSANFLAFLCVLFAFLLGCTEPALKTEPISSCETVESSYKLGFSSKWERVQKFPASGLFVTESHYVTTADGFGGSWPKSGTDKMDSHLAASCNLLKSFMPSADCSVAYSTKEPWTRVWTPSEGGGRIGAGARAEIPSPEMEMWQGNMMFKGSLPPMGTKFLMKANGKAVVVSFGYEVGPGSEKWLGGVTREVHYYLGTGNDKPLWIGLLKDQSLPFGPITCK